jgi:hypothetical protein
MKNSKKKGFFGLDSPDALGSTVEPYASPSYLPDDDDDIESELDPGILQHPGEPSSTAANFHYYSCDTEVPVPLYFYFSQ